LTTPIRSPNAPEGEPDRRTCEGSVPDLSSHECDSVSRRSPTLTWVTIPILWAGRFAAIGAHASVRVHCIVERFIWYATTTCYGYVLA
jgi:hypothetical protein